MKHSISLFSTILVVLLLNSSCSKSCDSSSVSNVTPIVTNGTWQVSLFSERGVNETSDFSGYSFTFQSDGKLIVQKGGATVKQGSWTEDNSSGKLIINLGVKDNTNKPLGQLTDDWLLTSKSDTKISLTDDNTARNEILEFTKN